MNFENAFHLIVQYSHLIIIAIFGGFVLFGIKVSEHFHRPPEEKLTNAQYVFWIIAILLFFPVLGGSMVAIYILNGDMIGAVLAFQVGLTSPAIVQGIVIGAANSGRVIPMDIPDEA